jgi:hypothetical protein
MQIKVTGWDFFFLGPSGYRLQAMWGDEPMGGEQAGAYENVPANQNVK